MSTDLIAGDYVAGVSSSCCGAAVWSFWGEPMCSACERGCEVVNDDDPELMMRPAEPVYRKLD